MSDESKSAELKVYDDIELITRFLNKQLDPATAAHVRKLIEEDKDFRDLAAPLLYAWSVPTYAERHPRPPGEMEKAWDRFTKAAGFVHQRRKARKRRLWIASVIIAIAGISYFAFGDAVREKYVENRDYEAVADSGKEMTLRGGSHVLMNAGARLRSAKTDVEHMAHNVILKGSARFRVDLNLAGSPPEVHPLLVRTPSAIVVSGSGVLDVSVKGDTTYVEVATRNPNAGRAAG